MNLRREVSLPGQGRPTRNFSRGGRGTSFSALRAIKESFNRLHLN